MKLAIIIILIIIIISIAGMTHLYSQIAPIWKENWENCKSISEEKGAYVFYANLDGSCKLKICDYNVSEIQIDNITFKERCENWEYKDWIR